MSYLINPYRFGSPINILDVTSGDDAGVATLNHTVGLPASIVSGQRLIAVFASQENTTTWPAGWTELCDGGTGGQVNISAAYRDCDGSEGASITVTTGSSRADGWSVIRIAAGSFNPAAPEVGTIATGNDANPDCPSLTPSWGSLNTYWIAAAAGKQNATPRTVSSYPATFTENQTTQSTASTNAVFLAGLTAIAASKDPGTFTLSGSSQWAANTIAVRSAV